jgi:hypothetical protein
MKKKLQIMKSESEVKYTVIIAGWIISKALALVLPYNDGETHIVMRKNSFVRLLPYIGKMHYFDIRVDKKGEITLKRQTGNSKWSKNHVRVLREWRKCKVKFA